MKLLDPAEWTHLSFGCQGETKDVLALEQVDMSDLVETPYVRLGVLVVVLCVLIAAGFYLVSIFRDYAADDQEDASTVLANLEEMHRKGDISDQEFRTIQARTHRPPVGPSSIDDSTSSDGSSPNPKT